ncbi:MAG: uridine diphosphate-N-acetylglucosamine-binding protein YvcK [Nocardioidaceae bacterium]|nr:uridine diphosphate-N-acetylglucosamine-binding protein YvcK [Nocardioidaceae bacterium]
MCRCSSRSLGATSGRASGSCGSPSAARAASIAASPWPRPSRPGSPTRATRRGPSTATSARSDGVSVLPARVVALGGGHGLHASLSALRRVVTELTAVVTVADNGGSSGRLRGEFGVLPPGDLRMALAALCDDDEWGRTWERVVQHRFEGDGEMRGHVVGNLLIVGLWEEFGDPVEALDWVGRLLGAKGRVLPMAVTPMDIRADVVGLDPSDPSATTTVRGQVEVASTTGTIAGISLEPADPASCPEAVAAVLDADWVVLGPGSWYTSVIPHLMVPDLHDALTATRGKLIVILNLAAQEGETGGYGPVEHLAALLEHAPGLKVHTVVADPSSIPDREALDQAVSGQGSRLLVADVAVGDGTPRHDVARLAEALRKVMEGHPERD